MYKKAGIVLLASAALFAILLWTQSSGKPEEEYAALEKSMKAELEALPQEGAEAKDPRADWARRWKQFAEKYPRSPHSSRAHAWTLSLLSSMGDTQGLADYLQEAVRYPDNAAVPVIIDESVSQHMQAYGIPATRERLQQIAQKSKSSENQATAYAMLAYLEDDEPKKMEALQRIVLEYGTTKAGERARGELEGLKQVAVGAPAPLFEFADLKGRQVSLKDLKGRWVLLDFWATWCIPCVVEIPTMKAIHAQFNRNEKFAMLGISLDYDQEVFKSRVSKEQMNWSQHVDGKGWDNRISRLYRVTSLPHTVLVDPEGVIRYKRLPAAQLRKILEEKLL
ncbi:MAG: redoxin domain-containing protein [Acidobacteria bacterium]|nr:redoxin domain-containing protein [Acidobacteriota bacterium]